MLCSKGRLVWCVTCLAVALLIGGAVGPVAAGGGPEPGWVVDGTGGFNGYPTITGNITIEPAKMKPAIGSLALVDFTGKCENGAPVTLRAFFPLPETGLPPGDTIENSLKGIVIDSNPDNGLLSRCAVLATGATVGLAIQSVKVIPFPDTGGPIRGYYGAATLQFANIIKVP